MKLLKPIIPSGSEQSIDREMRKRESEKKIRAFSLAAGKAGQSQIESSTFFPSSCFPGGEWPWEQTCFVPHEGDAGESRLTQPAAG